MEALISKFLLYGALIISLNNYILGKTKLWAVGHIGFFGIGMFVSGHLLEYSDYNIISVLGICIILGISFALLLSFFSFKLQEDFFVIASVAFCLFVYYIQEAIHFGGYSEIEIFFNNSIFNSNWIKIITLLLPWFLITIVISKLIFNDRLTRILKTIKQDNDLAKSYGLSPNLYNTFCFLIGSTIATTTGWFYTIYWGNTDPSIVTLFEGIFIFSVIIFTGIDSIRGSLLGTIYIVIVPFIITELLKRLKLPFSFDVDIMMKLILGIMFVYFIIFYANKTKSFTNN